MAYTSEITSAQKYQMFSPFFQSTRAQGENKRVDYACLFCNQPVKPLTVAGRSFTGTAITWAHVECLRAVPGASISTDGKAKMKAHTAFKERQSVARKAANAEKAPAQHVCPSLDETAIRAAIDAEYEERMQRVIVAITTRDQRIASLEEEVRVLRAPSIALTYVEPAPVEETPAPLIAHPEATHDQDKPGVIRCGRPTKSGDACKWNIAKSACRHHGGHAAVVQAMSDPQNETTVDVVEQETTPAPTVPTFGTERPVKGTHVAVYDGMNEAGTIFGLGGPNFQNAASTTEYHGYNYFATDELRPTMRQLVQGSSVSVTVADKYITEVRVLVEGETATEAQRAASKAKRNARRNG